MDSLRFALLLIGLVIVLGIYLWDIFRGPGAAPRRGRKRRGGGSGLLMAERQAVGDVPKTGSRARAAPRPASSASGSASAAPAPRSPSAPRSASSASGTVPAAPRSASSASASAPAAPAPRPASAPSPGSPPADDELLVIFVRARPGSVFRGPAIFSAARAAGMELGKRDIFHHLPGQGAGAPPLFSMTDMYQPGTFSAKSATTMKTGGLALILYPARRGREGAAANLIFDHFLASARLIARSLDGLLFLDRLAPLEDQHIRSLRSRYCAAGAQAS